MRKGLVSTLGFAMIFALSFSLTTHATPLTQRGETPAQAQDHKTDVEKTTQSHVEGVRDNKTDAEVQAKREQIEQKIADKKAAITQKLEGKRATDCTAKEARINRILDDRVTAAETHLETFRQIEDRLVAFVTDEAIVVDADNAHQLVMTGERAKAEAAITAAAQENFSCADADATQPGKIVMDVVADQKQALKDYREAIRAYADAIKSSIETTQTPDDTVTEQKETEVTQ